MPMKNKPGFLSMVTNTSDENVLAEEERWYFLTFQMRISGSSFLPLYHNTQEGNIKIYKVKQIPVY